MPSTKLTFMFLINNHSARDNSSIVFLILCSFLVCMVLGTQNTQNSNQMTLKQKLEDERERIKVHHSSNFLRIPGGGQRHENFNLRPGKATTQHIVNPHNKFYQRLNKHETHPPRPPPPPPSLPIKSKLTNNNIRRPTDNSSFYPEISSNVISSLAVICGVLFTMTIFMLEYDAIKKVQAEQHEQAAKLRENLLLKLIPEDLNSSSRFSSSSSSEEEGEEKESDEESDEKKGKSIGKLHVASGIVGITGQGLHIAGSKAFISIEAFKLAQNLQRVIGQLVRSTGDTGAVAATSNLDNPTTSFPFNSTTPFSSSSGGGGVGNSNKTLDFSHLSEPERLQILHELQTLQKNVTEIVNANGHSNDLNPTFLNISTIPSGTEALQNQFLLPYLEELGGVDLGSILKLAENKNNTLLFEDENNGSDLDY